MVCSIINQLMYVESVYLKFRGWYPRCCSANGEIMWEAPKCKDTLYSQNEALAIQKDSDRLRWKEQYSILYNLFPNAKQNSYRISG